jgi:hypothetical protein
VKVQHHVGLSLSVAVAVYAVNRSVAMAAASFVAGVFVDVDHVFDYLREYGLRLDGRFFFRSFHQTLYRHVVLFLHSWEWLILLAAAALWSRGGSVLTGVCIGLGQHLVADQFTNGISRWGYFFFYRIGKKFVTGRIFPGKGLP